MLLFVIVKRKHVKTITKHRSSTNRMSSRQNQFPTNYYPFLTNFITITTITPHEKWHIPPVQEPQKPFFPTNFVTMNHNTRRTCTINGRQRMGCQTDTIYFHSHYLFSDRTGNNHNYIQRTIYKTKWHIPPVQNHQETLNKTIHSIYQEWSTTAVRSGKPSRANTINRHGNTTH